MKKQFKKLQSGFTIIEVVIVLAIAALIMVIVFLAVPALQRNSRNNQYKTEARNLVAAIQEWQGNNGNAQLSTINVATAATIVTSANNKKVTTLNVVAPGTTPVASTLNAAWLSTDTSCAAINTAGASPRSQALNTGITNKNTLVFAIESTAGNIQPQCIDF